MDNTNKKNAKRHPTVCTAHHKFHIVVCVIIIDARTPTIGQSTRGGDIKTKGKRKVVASKIGGNTANVPMHVKYR